MRSTATNRGRRLASTLATLSFVLGATLGAATNTQANIHSPASIKHKHVTLQTMAGHDEVHVSSTDGVSWNTIEAKPLKFTSNINIDTYWPGVVHRYGLFLGKCDGGNCIGTPQMFLENTNTRDVAHIRLFWFSGNKIPNFEYGIRKNLYGPEIAEQCTEQMSQAGDTNSDIVFNKTLDVTLIAETYKDLDGKRLLAYVIGDELTSGDVASSTTTSVKVRCRAFQEEPEPALETVPLTDLQVFLSTFQGLYSEKSGLARCKKLRVLVRATAADHGLARVGLSMTQNGDLSHTNVDIETTSMGDGSYQAEFTRWVNVSEYTHVNAMAMEMDGDVASGINSGWKDISLMCGGDGPGSELVIEPDDNEGPLTPEGEREPIDDVAPLPIPERPPVPPIRDFAGDKSTGN